MRARLLLLSWFARAARPVVAGLRPAVRADVAAGMVRLIDALERGWQAERLARRLDTFEDRREAALVTLREVGAPMADLPGVEMWFGGGRPDRDQSRARR